MKLSHQTIELEPTHPFVIARGGYAHHRNVIVRITDDDGIEGFGEAAPNRYYGESVATVISALGQFKPILERADPMSLESIEVQLSRTLRGNASAKSAVSSALHDLLGKRLGLPIHRLWGLDPETAPQSSFTIAIAENHELEQRVREAREYPILKIKLGTDRDMEIVRIVRDAAPDKRLRVDANAAWTAKHAVRMSEFLVEHGVEMLEQPVAGNDIEGLRFVRKRAKLPVFADESCLVATDIPKLAGAVDGINIKLAKCGSLREAMRMVHTARALDMQVMAGCMIESSLGISAIAQIAPLLDAADFDGAALLAADPFRGASIAGGSIKLSDAPGLGASPALSGDLTTAFQGA
ncbi:MAG: L-Ala-D/L-Glu epimerase [Gemmatimonadaceae bacterium]|nr:L-Ala-D/L-Glu epimerase [Gemmatimonadaceae bacterium]